MSKAIPGSSYAVSCFMFLRVMGLIYFLAFVSLALQAPALFGPQGILSGPFSDSQLKLLSWAGAFFSVLILAGIRPTIFLALNWCLYLFFFSIGGPFLSFQWDTLLLETGFLTIFLSAGGGHGIIRFFLKLLLFKVMFSSGLVKLSSGDPVWRGLTALRYHFETQPLPVEISWYAHQLPAAVLKAACAAVLFIELVIPFLIFFPRQLRHFSAWVLIGLQCLIAFTGNYNFFNLLTIALCLLILDDTIWSSKIPVPKNMRSRRAWLIYPAAVLIFTANLRVFPILEILPLANSYGLFAVMTTSRPEIVIEGSNDNENWLAYEFKYKPGDLSRKPVLVQPHQPRLDWQMWFAALGSWRDNRWFLQFCSKLLEGSPEVLKLLKTNPFPEKAPKYIRALVYEYHFTSFKEKKKSGEWWKRELKGLYCPVMSLKDASGAASASSSTKLP